jgi:hypothetical protein
MALADYVRIFCAPPAPPPQRKKVTIEYLSESEALSQPRPRS